MCKTAIFKEYEIKKAKKNLKPLLLVILSLNVYLLFKTKLLSKPTKNPIALLK